MKNKESHLRTLVHPFPMVFDAASRVLILGSFPSVKAVADGYYYANPHNRFYQVLSAVFDADFVSVPWEGKKAMLLERHIALHDSIGYCQIIGSSDAKIKDVQPSNLREILASARIQKVICNGVEAYQEYKRFFADIDIPVARAPSTSPANAKMRLGDLVAEWEVLFGDILTS
ncbi:MAG: DNA-deoxyinosine glycosylase [Bacilli bacterium]|jgi:hypoxanthine-DNA glycosylase